MGQDARTERGGRRRTAERLRGTVLLLADDAALAAAVCGALADTAWTPSAVRRSGSGPDEAALPPDARAVVAAVATDGDTAALADAAALAAGRLPLVVVSTAPSAATATVRAGLGAAACLTDDELGRLPEVLRREIALACAPDAVDRVAVSLVAPLCGAARFDEYCDRLALMLGASHVLVLVADRGDHLVVGGARTPDDASPPASRLTPADVASMIAEKRGVATATERQLGIPAGHQRLWTPLRCSGQPLTDLGVQPVQVVARCGASFGAAERAAVDRLAPLAALAVARAGEVAALQRTDAVKTEFVRTVSHELRTPLNTVIGYADLLVEEAFGPLDDEQRRILRRVGDRARGLLEVIAATLDLPGVSGGRVSLETRPVSVGALLAELEADTREWGARDDLEYTWDVAADLPTIVTDPGKLRVLLKNLIANAMKFTDRGGITVRARARDGGVELSVEDTGIGIEGEAVHFVFDAFRQANAAATGKYGGVGLGLYIVRRLVAMLGGRLRVESEIDVGSKFHVWLPEGE